MESQYQQAYYDLPLRGHKLSLDIQPKTTKARKQYELMMFVLQVLLVSWVCCLSCREEVVSGR